VNIVDGRVVIVEPVWIGRRIRDMFLNRDKSILILTDDSHVINISVDHDGLKRNNKNPGYQGVGILDKCIVCHHFDRSTPASLAPSLNGILGRKVAGDSYEKYSDAIKKINRSWDQEFLIKFLLDPQAVVPGTSMPNLELSVDDAKEIVRVLSK
jgi:cytochrome c2